MTSRFIAFPVLALLGVAAAAPAQESGSIPMPPPAEAGSYDPQLTAKEAALANWTLAVSGIRAGKIVSDTVVAAAATDTPYDDLTTQAQFALKTMVLRYNSANWLFAADSGVAPIDGAVILAAVQAAAADCASEGCGVERAALAEAFANASAAFVRTGDAAAQAARAQEPKSDRDLMIGILEAMADYLAGPGWYSDLSLTDVGRDGEEVSARIVGALAIWRNVEPYVGLTSAEVDDAVNAAIDTLLRDLRRNTRNKPVLAADSAEIAALRSSTEALAAELYRAADLFRG
ncbi:hypothetical protein [Rhodovulum marinum]|uniref:PilJ/NarX-like methyl-accepting chemotaxis transducer n=1 Tax=Rhodovulum marinum TaxID=320662 RepID=A0A4R2PVC7_9RHOB|nr:hypothetical protein [Rhodovulum marinum]TCP39877.1 hypothetical protein EV662_1092 [Rhodovulum marinum]